MQDTKELLKKVPTKKLLQAVLSILVEFVEQKTDSISFYCWLDTNILGLDSEELITLGMVLSEIRRRELESALTAPSSKLGKY